LTVGFADRLLEAVSHAGAPLCVGIDPFPALMSTALFGDPRQDPEALVRFGAALMEATAPYAACFKPQLGLFEPFGPDGYAAARTLCAVARDMGRLTILDAKRGDIGSTAEGYAQASLGPFPGFDADCVTVNPYMGADTLAPFLSLAAAQSKGVAVLVRTSNPGARDLQDLRVGDEPLWAQTARMLAPLTAPLLGESGFSGLMVVAGATYPEEAKALRALLPKALFLVPGYGAQGAGAKDALAGFVRGPDGLKRGGVVNSSRGIAYPKGAEGASSMAAWRALITAAAKAAQEDLAAAAVD
jgi:orotidine-5'-phosphate decarboxylase